MKKSRARLRPQSRDAKKPARKKSAGSRKTAPSPRAAASSRAHRVPDLESLQERLREAQETLEAIRRGDVDAVMVKGSHGNQVYSLAGAEHPYRVYLEHMQEGAVTVSAEGVILYCNRRFSEMVQLPLERVIGADIGRHLSPDAWQEIARGLSRTDHVVKQERSLAGATGATLPVNLTASRLPLDGQKVIGLVVTDLSGQRERAQLQLGKELAEKANLAKDNFLAALSHELRTPLTPALMVAASLENDLSLPEETRRHLSTIRRNVELEARLIDDLLDLTRIARGKLELHTGRIDVQASVRGAVEICQPDIEAKRQQLHLHLDAALHETTGDAVRVQQVMWNLIRNAAKFTPVGGSITIRTGNTDGHVSVEIADTGIGFEQEIEPRLFQAFEQGGRQITQQFGGLGLGLAISRSIVEAHGGSIRAQSPGPGKGATFTLELPVLKPERGPAKTQPRASSAPFASPKLRILLVEDHEDTRANLALLLRSYQHEVKAAASAQEALETAAAEKFDLVISDLGLPDQSGLAMMSLLRDRFGLKGIAVSGYGMDDDIAQSREAGFVHHLTKPIAFDRLKLLIAEMAR